ncbi:helix-turn-helix domain-containing protein [Nitratireductor soli]|uniref:helix-turn-helix domain-containing protein n=1 Tax=Nitratireductor soli TaxID=1670619 RepID=UPI00065E8726|nr:helix-turn-helix domain-containing protein [Nitratireductor soli]
MTSTAQTRGLISIGDVSHADRKTAADGNGLRSAAIEDAAVQASMQPWIGMECYQLSRGRWLAHMDSLDLGSQQVVRERQDAAVQKLGITPTNLCTISYCTPDPAFRFSEHSAEDAGTIFFMPENTAFDLYVPAGTQTAYISFSEEEFIRGAQALSPKAWDRPPRKVVQFSTTRKNDLSLALDLWLRSANAAVMRGESVDPGVLRSIILQTSLRTASATTQDDAKPLSRAARSRALRTCRMARSYVEARFAEHKVPTIVDICVSIGVCERTLQYAFHEYVGMSPLAYLRLCRLNRARSALRAADAKSTTVTRIAMQFGFLHLGRFAGEYKQVFEETPTATLARCA